jgi:hypothetical protein
MLTVYCRERMQIKISKGKRHIELHTGETRYKHLVVLLQ